MIELPNYLSEDESFIYCPKENIKDIYSTILMIPIDQRYDVDDMRRIVKIINDYE